MLKSQLQLALQAVSYIRELRYVFTLHLVIYEGLPNYRTPQGFLRSLVAWLLFLLARGLAMIAVEFHLVSSASVPELFNGSQDMKDRFRSRYLSTALTHIPLLADGTLHSNELHSTAFCTGLKRSE